MTNAFVESALITTIIQEHLRYGMHVITVTPGGVANASGAPVTGLIASAAGVHIGDDTKKAVSCEPLIK